MCRVCAVHKMAYFAYKMRFDAVLNSMSGLPFLYSFLVAGDNFASKIADCKILNKSLHSAPNYGIFEREKVFFIYEDSAKSSPTEICCSIRAVS